MRGARARRDVDLADSVLRRRTNGPAAHSFSKTSACCSSNATNSIRAIDSSRIAPNSTTTWRCSSSKAALHALETRWQRATAATLLDALWHVRERRLLERVRSGLVNQLGRCAERARDYEFALSAYARTTRAPGRERRTRLLRRLGDDHAARVLLDAIDHAPWCAGERFFAQQFRAGRRAPRRSIPERVLRLPEQPGVSVEAAALAALTCGGGSGAASRKSAAARDVGTRVLGRRVCAGRSRIRQPVSGSPGGSVLERFPPHARRRYRVALRRAARAGAPAYEPSARPQMQNAASPTRWSTGARSTRRSIDRATSMVPSRDLDIVVRLHARRPRTNTYRFSGP